MRVATDGSLAKVMGSTVGQGLISPSVPAYCARRGPDSPAHPLSALWMGKGPVQPEYASPS